MLLGVTTSASPPDHEVDAFAEALGDFMRATRRVRGRFAAEREEGELSLSQFHVLDTIERAGAPLPVREVALGAGVAAPTVTRMLDGLERDGLVARERCAEDRRVVRVRLTDAGVARMAAGREHVRRWRRDLFASLPPAERRRAAAVLRHLSAAMDGLA